MIVHRRLPFQRRVMLVTAVTAFPALLATGVLLWDLDANPILRGTLFALVGLWAIFGVLAVRALIVHPLRSLTSVLEALREGDYQLRARYVDHDDALGEVMAEVNALSRKLYEQRLGSLEADVLLDKLLAEVDIAIFAFDAGHRLSRVNRAGEALLGAQAAQVIGRTADQLGLAAMLGESSGRTMSHEFPGGAGRWEIRRRRFREGGRPHELLVISDLSHALREEERQAWRRLVRVIGHELNNSLAPVRSTAATLRKLIHREPLPPDWREDTLAGLGIVHDRAESLSRFMGAYARLARLPPPVPADVSFAALAAHVASLFAGRVVVEPCADVSLTADRDQLEQVLINLLKNAIEADAAGIVHIRWGALAENVLIDVEDNGPGLARTDSLWVPFFTTKPGGAGIGLALSREIVENHGGTITLENRANARGCVARVTLPMQPNCHGTAKGSEQIGPRNS